MNKQRIFKSFMVFLLAIFAAVMLTACGGGSNYPIEGIEREGVYAKAGEITVTNEELYNEFRFEGLPTLTTMIDEKILADYLAKIDLSQEDQKEYLIDQINDSVYGLNDLEQLEKYYGGEDREGSKRIKVLTFVDNLVVVGKIPTNEKDAIVTELMDSLTFDDYENETLLSLFENKLAQRILAQEKLAEELEDEESDAYIEEKDLVSQWKSYHKGRYDVKVFIVDFLNIKEQKAVLKKLGVKIFSTGQWIHIPDIRIPEGNEGYVDVSADTYISGIIEELGIEHTPAGVEEFDGNTVSEEDFDKYYDKYSFSESRDAERVFHNLDESVLEVLVQIYNELNFDKVMLVDGVIYEAELDADGETLIQGEEKDLTIGYEDFSNTSLRSHIYNTLKVDIDEDDTTSRRYTRTPSTFGESRYVAYKFEDGKALEENILNEDGDAFQDNEDAQAIKDEMRVELEEKRLSATYIQTKFDEFVEDKKISIFDPILRKQYENRNEYDGAKKVKDSSIIAEVEGEKITVKEFFDEMEKAFGISIATDLLANKVIREKYYDEITDEEHKQFKENLKNLLLQFSQDAFATSGFPASMGRDQFLLQAFKATSNQDAIEKLYIIPKVRVLHKQDLEAQYDDIYEKFAKLSKNYYENYKGFEASHLLYYIDLDQDGTPDDPSELKEENLEKYNKIRENLVELMIAVNSRIDEFASIDKGISKVIEEFNDATRIDSEHVNGSKANRFAEFKKIGFQLKTESLSTITNSSNFLSSSSRLDETFYNKAMEVYEETKEMGKEELPVLDLLDGYNAITVDSLDEIESAFGWHQIKSDKISKLASAKLTDESLAESNTPVDPEDPDGEKLSALNENDYVNATQIKIYLDEDNSEYSVQIEVKKALEDQFEPIRNRYNSNKMQAEILYKTLENAGITFTNQDNNDKLDVVREINRDQVFNYELGTDENFDALWSMWFSEEFFG